MIGTLRVVKVSYCSFLFSQEKLGDGAFVCSFCYIILYFMFFRSNCVLRIYTERERESVCVCVCNSENEEILFWTEHKNSNLHAPHAHSPHHIKKKKKVSTYTIYDYIVDTARFIKDMQRRFDVASHEFPHTLYGDPLKLTGLYIYNVYWYMLFFWILKKIRETKKKK